ncbi:hypothetical protein DM02DRAFT_689864 [Periconia macrospinosa]|uniref:Uncharacterized protein n=1 Tax=Periconia macrospinosa TaxID=97972 RepID=A0A2V1DBX8_9PLEO|nr:hypothetical protein DM02DRAFT_689864 [Periconia macrospinosa]
MDIPKPSAKRPPKLKKALNRVSCGLCFPSTTPSDKYETQQPSTAPVELTLLSPGTEQERNRNSGSSPPSTPRALVPSANNESTISLLPQNEPGKESRNGGGSTWHQNPLRPDPLINRVAGMPLPKPLPPSRFMEHGLERDMPKDEQQGIAVASSSGGTSVDEPHRPCTRYNCTAPLPCVEQSPQEIQEISNTETVKGVISSHPGQSSKKDKTKKQLRDRSHSAAASCGSGGGDEHTTPTTSITTMTTTTYTHQHKKKRTMGTSVLHSSKLAGPKDSFSEVSHASAPQSSPPLPFHLKPKHRSRSKHRPKNLPPSPCTKTPEHLSPDVTRAPTPEIASRSRYRGRRTLMSSHPLPPSPSPPRPASTLSDGWEDGSVLGDAVKKEKYAWNKPLGHLIPKGCKVMQTQSRNHLLVVPQDEAGPVNKGGTPPV